MMRIEDFIEEIYVTENNPGAKPSRAETNKKVEPKHLFPNRHGIGWTILRTTLAIMFVVCHSIVALIFISSFLTVIAFSITIIIDMGLEMVYPGVAEKSKKTFLSLCLFFLILCMYFILCLILSLLYQVLKIVLLRTSLAFNLFRCAVTLCILIGGGVWTVAEKGTSTTITFPEYFWTTAKLSWFFGLSSTLIGAVLLLVWFFSNRVNDKNTIIGFIVLAMIALVTACITPIVFGVVVGTLSFVIILPFCAIFALILAFCRGNAKDRKVFVFNRNFCIFFLVFLLFIGTCTTYLTASSTCPINCKDEIKESFKTVANIQLSGQYKLCSLAWTSINLNIVELAFIANLTYNSNVDRGNETKVQALANGFFQNRSIQWTTKIFTKSSRRLVHLQYNNINILGIRGPIDANERARDGRLWLEVAILQSIGLVLPSVISQYPMDFISQYVLAASVIKSIFSNGSSEGNLQEVESYINELKTNGEVILVGHSFGGGLAKIIGARQKVQSIAFSSPGIAYGHLKFGFKLEDASLYTTTISPQNDLFSLLDMNVGLEQTITCRAKTSSQCHLMAMTYCELHNVCQLGNDDCFSMLDN